MLRKIIIASLMFSTLSFGETSEDECKRHISDGRYISTILIDNPFRTEASKWYSLLGDAYRSFVKAGEICKGEARIFSVQSSITIAHMLDVKCTQLLDEGKSTMLSFDSRKVPLEVTYMMLHTAVNTFRDAETICRPHTEELKTAIKYRKLANEAFIDWEQQLVSFK